MISKTGEVAIYAASLRFCPISNFSLYEKFIIESKQKDPSQRRVRVLSTYPQLTIQLYIFVLYFIHNNKKKPLPSNKSNHNRLSVTLAGTALNWFERESTSEVRTSVISYEASITHLIAKRKFFHALIFGMVKSGYSKERYFYDY